MTQSTCTSIETLIEALPGVYGGKPRLARSGLPILQLASDYRSGMTLDDLKQAFPQIDEASLHAGIAYYLLNQESIDEELRQRDEEGRAALARWESEWQRERN